MAETKARTTWLRTFDVETDQPVEGSIKGRIPLWLEGSLIRNGSGIHEIGNSKMDHLFDGFAVLNKFEISNGKATYINRILQSDAYLTSKEANRLTMAQFGTLSFPDPCKSLLGRFMSRLQLSSDRTDNCGVNVCYFGDKLYAMTETPLMREVDLKTLETLGEKVDVSKLVAVHHATAHPHVDPDGTVYNMGNSAGQRGCKYNIVRFPPGEKSLSEPMICASFPSRWKMSHSYYHSFAITENYFIFVEYPLTLNVMKLMTMPMHRKPVSALMEWNPSITTRISLADRKSGEMLNTFYETQALFCFHHGNAFEKDGHVVMDLSSYDDATIISDLSVANLKQGKFNATLRYSRLVMPLNSKSSQPTTETEKKEKENLVRLEGTECRAFLQKDGSIWCEPEVLFDRKLEFPRINYSLNGKDYCYVYGAVFEKNSAEFSSIVKINVKTREVKEWSKPGFSPSEPVFVPSPNAAAEDDGVILFSAVADTDNHRVLLIILDASTFEEVACVDFTAKGTVTRDFHGIFTQKK